MDKSNPHEWFTAGEVAALAKAHGVRGVPLTKSGMLRWVRRLVRDGFGDEVDALCRVRPGSRGGGGMECHWCFWHEGLLALLDADIKRRDEAARWAARVAKDDALLALHYAKPPPKKGR